MKIAILGTRGIPNNYGGYEAFAEKFSVQMVERGHEVSVFSSSLHPYRQNNYKGVEIIHCKDPENIVGTTGQFIYDLNCIRVCRKRKFDVILQLGYTSSSIWSFLFPPEQLVITNMDGLEWKRDKYSWPVKKFLKQAEKWAVENSNELIADNIAIKNYLFKEYGADADFIPYAAEISNKPIASELMGLSVKPFQYNLIVSRIEPENNVEAIIRGHVQSNVKATLLIVGGIQSRYARRLREKYSSSQIVFLDGVYDVAKLNALRWFSNVYFHGHSVGGTNPSLLEAMASSALICAHDNVFNRAVLGLDGFYFNDTGDIKNLLEKQLLKQNFSHFTEHNLRKIAHDYNWRKITTAYEQIFIKCMEAK